MEQKIAIAIVIGCIITPSEAEAECIHNISHLCVRSATRLIFSS